MFFGAIFLLFFLIFSCLFRVLSIHDSIAFQAEEETEEEADIRKAIALSLIPVMLTGLRVVVMCRYLSCIAFVELLLGPPRWSCSIIATFTA